MKLRLPIPLFRRNKTADDIEDTTKTFAPTPTPNTEYTIRTWAGVTSYPTPNEEDALKDDTLYSVLKLLREIQIGGGWEIVGDEITDEMRAFFSEMMDNEPFLELVGAISDALWTRYVLAIQKWKSWNGYWIPHGWKVVPHNAISFSTDEYGQVVGVQIQTSAGLYQLGQLDYILYTRGSSFNHPLGRSEYDYMKPLLEKKRKIEDSIVSHIDRFGSPVVLGRYRVGSPRSMQDDLMEMLRKLRASSVAVVPEGTGIEMIEPKAGSSGVQLMEAVLGMYERRIARYLMGGVLAMYESQFSTRAQAQVHWDLVRTLVSYQQLRIEMAINQLLVAPVLKLNGLDWNIRWMLKDPGVTDKASTSRWVVDLVNVGYLDEDDRQRIRSLFGLE